MKKIVLCSLLVCTLFFLSPKVGAENINTMDAVFKIQAYSYNKLSDMYVLQQYGSAVLIADNILLTNAHVVTDTNGTLNLQYEACQTISNEEPPKCFSTLQLMKYDKNSDLALLQIVNPSENMPNPVIIWSGDLAVGDAIHIIGYPANGGETITTTQWTIAWFEKNYYKTDANVDEWNSWWWSFDTAWSFVGIPTFVVNGQTTLWYIIPITTIKKFIGWEIGTIYKTKYATVFDKRLKSIYSTQSVGNIENNLFTTPNFQDIGLTLNSIVEKKNNNLYSYALSNKNESTVDILSLIATDNATITKYIANTMKELNDGKVSPKKSIKKIGNTTRTVISFGNSDRVGYDYIQTTSTNKTYLEFTVLVDKEDINSDLADLIQFVESSTIKKTTIKPEVFNLPVIKLSSKWNVSIVKWIKNNGMSLTVFANNWNYVSELSAYIGDKWDTLKNVTSQLKDAYENMNMTVASETSKYPWTISIMRITDENDKVSLSSLGMKKYAANNLFIHIATKLNTSSSKQEAITLAYKILGLE